jgi:flagellar protein FlaJ
MKLLKQHYIGIAIGILILIGDVALFYGQRVFEFIIGIAIIVAALPFITAFLTEVGREKGKEEMFLEFARNLVESVKAGTPISKSIINVGRKEYGSLTPHINKLANQITVGIPVSQALATFANDVKNKVVSRSIYLIIQAEKSGGHIDLILESTAKSVSEVEDLQKERQSSMYNLVIEGYIIFFIFLVIMIAVQTKFIPTMLQTVAESGSGAGMGGLSFGAGGGAGVSTDVLGRLFLWLIIVQGFFCGLVIGKLSEGSVKAGVKHSVIIVTMAYLITTGVQAFLA